jgi:hypothetical protein
MSNGQNTPNQSAISPDLMGLAIASILGKKGGVDLSSALGDPFLAYLSGASASRTQLSEGELYARYAPTFLYIQDNEPEGSWRKQAAALIANGVPTYRVKEEIQSFLANNPDQQGLSTSKDVDSFIEGLAKEQLNVQSEALKQRENDPFAKAGYPSPDTQYTIDDIVNMAPEQFSALQQKADAAQPEYLKLIAGIDEKYGKPIMMERPTERPKSESGKTSKLSKSNVMNSEITRAGVARYVADGYRLTPEQVMQPDRNDPKQVEANKRFMKEMERRGDMAGILAQGGPKPSVGTIAKKGVRGTLVATNPVIGLITRIAGLTKDDGLTPTERKMKQDEEAQEAEQPEMVADRAAMAREKAVGDVAKSLLSRRVGMPGYYEQAMGLLAQNIQSDLAKSGRTPLGDALIKSALLARATRANG